MLPAGDVRIAGPRTKGKHSYIVTAFLPRLPCPSLTSLSSLILRIWLGWFGMGPGDAARGPCSCAACLCTYIYTHIHDANGRAARTGQDDWLPYRSFASGDTGQ